MYSGSSSSNFCSLPSPLHLQLLTYAHQYHSSSKMKFTTAASAFFALALSLTATVGALPTETVAKRDVWSPTIIEPNASTVWTSGEIRNVTWSVVLRSLPANRSFLTLLNML